MSAAAAGQMSAAETRQMSAVETRQIYSIGTRRSTVFIVDACRVPTADTWLVSAPGICPVSAEETNHLFFVGAGKMSSVEATQMFAD